MILELKTYPNAILKKVAQEVQELTPELVQLSKDMLETMYHSRGVGLAAPQIGKSIRLIVMDCSENKSRPYVFFNPIVKDGLGKIIDVEGCLSVPGVEANVQRFEKITMTGRNENWEYVEISAEDLLGRCFQHELDHLNGVLFIDRLTPLQKFKVRKLLAELEAKVIC